MLDILHGESTWYRLGNSDLPNPEPNPDPEPGTPGDGSGGETNPPLKKVTFSVEKRSIGEGDITSQTTVELEDGDTAFTLLHRELTDRSIALEYSGADESTYVQAIDGLGEFDHGPLSGWMYEVNGQFPSVSAGVYELKDGDVLRWRYTTNLGEDLGEEPIPGTDEEIIHVSAGQSPIYVNQLEIAKDVIKLQFTEEILPEVTSVSNSTYMFIENETSVISGGSDNQIQLPRDLNTSDPDLINKINNSLSTNNQILSALVTRIKVGGEQDILFDKFVTIKLLGQGDKEAGMLNANQEFHPILKYENASEHNDLEAYAYRDNNDLIIKTKHFSEFLAYSVTSNNGGNEGEGDGSGSGGNGGDPVPPVSPTPTQSNITLSVEKRTIGQGDIVGKATVKVNEGDTAFTVLQKAISQNNISMDYSGSGASIYVKSIDGLGEFDHGAQSGWMYEVNGEFPNVSAGIFEVKDGDVVRWRYTTNLGKDLGAPEFNPDPSGPGSNPGNSNTEQMPSLETTKTYIDKISSWILQNRNFMIQDNFNDWDVLALARAGKEVPVSYASTLLNYIQSKNGEFRLVTDYERMTLAAIAIGKDPSNLSGTNFLEKIYNNSRMTNQGTNGLVFGLIALDAKETKIPVDALWTREKLVAELLNQQNQDGGFPISKSSGSDSDIDMTAMALQALSNYQDQVKVKQAVEKALQWLSNQQLENGGFKSFGAESSESISQVMIALTSLDIKFSDKRFVKSKGNLMTAWLTYMNKDGGIAHSAGGKSDYMATQQGLLALAAYERQLSKSNRLYDMTDVSTETGKPSISYTDEHLIASWAIEGVNRASELGYMKGSGTDSARFEPKRNITRAEFTAIIARYAGLESSESTSGFIDVPSTSWYAGYVSIAKEKGWISGITKDKFAPNEPITRQEMATILVRMIGETGDSVSSDFVKDQQLIAKWALPYVKYVYDNGIMRGDGGNFRPQSAVTREMAAVIMVRMHDLKSR
nr:DUF4430 domain-containing protein [Paenibacillus sp. Marseille-Q4541]